MISLFKAIIKNFLYNLNLKYKLLIIYIIIIILPIISLSFIVYHELTKNFNQQLVYSVKQGFEQTLISLENTIDRYDTLSLTISRSDMFPKLISKIGTAYPVNKQQLDKINLDKEIYSSISRTKLKAFNIYFIDDFAYFTNNQNYYNINQIEAQQWYEIFYHNFTYNKNTLLLCPPSYLPENSVQEEKFVAIARAIINPLKYDEFLGLLRIDLPESYFVEILKNNNSFPDSLTFMQTSEGEIFSSTDSYLMDEYQAYDIINRLGIKEAWVEKKINGKDYLINSEPIGKYNCNLITIIPYKQILKPSVNIRNLILILIIVFSIIIFASAVLISFTMTNRIMTVAKHMNLVKTGQLKLIETDPTKDEIGKLIESYNYMIHEMNKLIQLQYEQGKELKNAELSALQAQINPHFLYNTLDMINWFAANHMVSEIRTAVISLAKFYKLSLSKGHEEISIKDEIMHATMYMQLQNLRFQDQINFNVEVEEEIKNYKIIKTIFQPIIENSIQHGIMEKSEKNGTISITAEANNSDIIFRISDDGIGMDQNRVDNILKNYIDKNDSNLNGYGVYNVHKRIQHYYGKNYGLKYSSQLGEGTVVEIKIPKINF